jgi:ATPase subunit of ABC transporter with duplicated ATPase domains
VFLLDEPTNDLDLDGLRRLEDFTQGLRGGAVIVSHDREYLARCVTSVVEIDVSLQQVRTYGGSYDSYLAERERARQLARDAYDDYTERRDELQARARRQRAWMAKGVRDAVLKARDNDKNIRKGRVEASEKQAAKARQT